MASYITTALCSCAAAIYEVVALETLSHYLSYHDEDGALGRVVQDCVDGLGACLESEREDEPSASRFWRSFLQCIALM